LGQRLKRFAFFMLAILAGAALGVAFGWEVAPVRYSETGPHALRRDFKTDIVLMAAEIYHEEGNLAMAMARLGFLSDQPPIALTQDAIAYAQEVQYSPDDLALMLVLSEDLENLGLEER
jgi:hypothetical protein